MEEEREEGSVGRGLQDPPPGSLGYRSPQPTSQSWTRHPHRSRSRLGSAGHPWSPARPRPLRSPRAARPSRAAGGARAHRAAGRPRSGAQQARGGSMPLLPLLAAAVPRSRAHRRRRALRLTSAGPAEAPLSTERVLAGRGALLRPRGQESWVEWEGSPEGREGAPPSRLGRRELHAAGVLQDAGFHAAPPVRRGSLRPRKLNTLNPAKGRAPPRSPGSQGPRWRLSLCST